MALLRGINVGGNRRVEMKRLKATFEGAGFDNVRTYINSGNVIFEAGDDATPAALRTTVETAIEDDFGFPVTVLLRDERTIHAVVSALPDAWVNDASSKCDVMFLGDDHDSVDVMAGLTIKPEIDHVKAAPGAIIWHVDRPYVTRSGMFKLIGTPLYAQMTVRNCNTVRKLADLME